MYRIWYRHTLISHRRQFMESFELQSAETVSDTVTLSRNMNSRTQYVVMCCDVEQHTDKVHESLILGRTTLENVTYYHVVTV